MVEHGAMSFVGGLRLYEVVANVIIQYLPIILNEVLPLEHVRCLDN